MPAPTETIWVAEPHTLAKHGILRKYLASWLPTLTMQRYHGRVIVIDGFCGPGEYARGEEGSPIIALRTFLEHQYRERMSEGTEFVFMFIDSDAERVRHLEEVAIPRLGELPENVKIGCHEGQFDEEMTHLLDYLDGKGANLAPSFAFVDPFGFSDTPMSIIRRILQHPRSEVFVTVMLRDVNRFLEHPNEAIAARWDELFGDDGWRDLTDEHRRLDALGDYYAEKLRESVDFVTSFRMLDQRNAPIYDLFFGTNHSGGLKKMKRAMWGVDQSGGFTFSDRDEASPVLFSEAPDHKVLRDLLVARYRPGIVTIEELEEFVLTDTPFHDGHIKRMTLKPMEADELIELVSPPAGRRRGTFPEGCRIRFV